MSEANEHFSFFTNIFGQISSNSIISYKGRLISNTKQKSIHNTRVEIQNQSSYLKYFKSCNIQYADEKGLFWSSG